MPGYYVYIKGEDGHFKDRHAVICENDEEAEARAKQFVDGHAVELWEEARKVAEFTPEK
jgi:hypothetical protein